DYKVTGVQTCALPIFIQLGEYHKINFYLLETVSLFMNIQITFYRERFNLQSAKFLRVDHEDAWVAVVYRVTDVTDKQFILKICKIGRASCRESVYMLV